MNFLVKMAERPPTEEERFQEFLDSLSADELRKLAADAEPSPTVRLDRLGGRVKQAEAMGREMAHVHGKTLEKQAWIGPAIAMAGRLAAGLGGRAALGQVAKGVAKDVVVNKAVGAIGNAMKPAAQPAQSAGQMAGAFKYANLASSLVNTVGATGKGNSFLRSAAGTMMRHPTAATAIAGGALGAAKGLVSDPGIDPQTGQPKSRMGAALRGGALGAGAGAAVGHFIPGAGAAVQGAGKTLSKEIRSKSTSWAPRAGGAAAPAKKWSDAMPQGGVLGGDWANQVKANHAAAAQPQGFHAQVQNAFRGTGSQPIGRNTAANVASNVAAQGGINVPLELQNPARVKLAFGMNIASMGGGENESWLAQFEGTPLLEQAIKLEEQSLMLEMEDMQRRQAEQERWKQEDFGRQAAYQQQDQLRLQRRMMMLDLAKHQAGMDAQAQAAQADPQGQAQQGQPDPTMQPNGPDPGGVSAPNDANPTMGKMAFQLSEPHPMAKVAVTLKELGIGAGLAGGAGLIGHASQGKDRNGRGALRGAGAGMLGLAAGAMLGHRGGRALAKGTKLQQAATLRRGATGGAAAGYLGGSVLGGRSAKKKDK
jgi:hypothetical protein